MVTRPQLDIVGNTALVFMVRVTITLAIAAVSYLFIENPIRGGALGRAWQAAICANGNSRRRIEACWIAASFLIAAFISAVAVAMAVAGSPVQPRYLAHAKVAAPKFPTIRDSQIQADGFVLNSPMLAMPAIAASAPPAAVAGIATGEVVTAIGDSVMLGAEDELRNVLGDRITIDADIGRQASTARTIIHALSTEGKLAPVVVLHIGDNGVFSESILGEIMDDLKKARRVVIMNVKVPRRWEDRNNTMLADAVLRYTNAVLVDWHRAGEDHPEFFWKDGHHLRPDGAKFYAALIADAVNSPATPPAHEPASVPSTVIASLIR
jgi:hypothetical protein